MRHYCEQLYDEMLPKLEVIHAESETMLERATRSFTVLEEHMKKLREFISQYEFRDVFEEIDFFKNQKPRFHRELLYWVEIAHMETEKPKGSKRFLIKFYERNARLHHEYLHRYHTLQIYYKMGHSHFDEQLFLKESEASTLRPEAHVDLDRNFATQAGSNLAKVQSAEKVLNYIESQIHFLKNKTEMVQVEETNYPRLRWTFSKAELIELLYALYCLGVFNNGKISLKDIFLWAEHYLFIKVTHYYNYMMQMRIRKKDRTPFLNRAIAALISRMDESDEFPRYK